MDPPIEDVDGLPRYPLSASDVHSLRTDMPFKALPENGLVSEAGVLGGGGGDGGGGRTWGHGVKGRRANERDGN